MSLIPEKLVYIMRNPGVPIKVGIGSECSKYNYNGLKLEVIPTFVVNPDKPNLVKRGEKWAGWNYGWKEVKPEKLEKANLPIKNLRLLHLNKRSEGGRAYKVLIENTYYVDLREDVLLDCLLSEGIENGIFKSEFVWAHVGSQFKLIKTYSKIYNEILNKNNSKLS